MAGQGIAPKLIDLGYQIIAISPDLPEKLRPSLEKNKLGYVLLSDSKMVASRAFGIAFKLDDEMLERFKKFGIDLEEASGETHHLLPVPSVFLVSEQGRIVFEHVDPSYKVRVDPDVLLAAAEAASD